MIYEIYLSNKGKPSITPIDGFFVIPKKVLNP